MSPNGKESLGPEEILWNYRNDKGLKQRENFNFYLLTHIPSLAIRTDDVQVPPGTSGRFIHT
jgi:hypothetical protein